MILPSWARVGAKVVCVDAGDTPHLAANAVYTIKGFSYPMDCPCLVLAELPAQVQDGWFISRFRPLHTLETDIATHFTALLDVREPVEA